ncbi:MAG: hypothetical protein KDB53_11000, partial [Planctomycetes bacterium]|nr:hypothetical protein [Planctomycetota bacterium]
EVLAQYIQDFQKTKLTGIFFDTEAFAEQAKLERDENGELTAESVRKLQEYFEGLDEATKRRFHTGGAYLDTEYAGVLFGKKAWKDDAVFNDMFNRVDADSGKSFAQLTEEFTPDDAVISKLKNRLDINRDDYGVEEDADLEEIFPTRKDRLVQEWKILKLLKKIHNELILVMDQGEVPIDLQQVAKDNNLSYFHFNRVTVMDLQKNEDVPGPYPFQLQGVSPGQILNMRSAITPETGPFDNGIVDEPGQHGSIWKLNSKTPNPIPSLVDVRDKVIEDYENKRKEELRDKALEAFEARMDAFLDEKVAEHAATVKSEIETEYQSEIEGLDAETDKDRIAEIRTQKDEEAEERINTEKEKYRAEAFDHAIAEPGEGVVVTQGFFLPEKVKSERPPVAAEATTVEKANSVLRREFRDLLDDPATQKYVDKGTVSEVVTSASFRTMKGIAKVVDKKKPSADEMFLYPNRIAQAEQGVRRSREPKDGEPAPSIWSLENLAKGDFKVSMDKIKAEIEKARDEERRQTESEKKLTEELERRKAERLKQAEDAKQAAMDEAKRLAEAAPANDKPVVVPSNPDEVVPPKKDD